MTCRKEKYKLFELVSPINHVTKDDPPAQLLYAYQFRCARQGPERRHPSPEIRPGLEGAHGQTRHRMRAQGPCASADSDELTFGFIKKHFGLP